MRCDDVDMKSIEQKIEEVRVAAVKKKDKVLHWMKSSRRSADSVRSWDGWGSSRPSSSCLLLFIGRRKSPLFMS